MAEWLKAAVLKTAVRGTVPGVRIPLPPPSPLRFDGVGRRLQAVARLSPRSGANPEPTSIKLSAMNRFAPYVLALVAASVALSAAPSQQTASRTTTYPIEAVHVTGNKRYSREQVVRISGFAPGASASVADLDAAIGRMAATGLFSKIGYKYAPDATGKRLVVTFEIEEPEWKVPVLFDNFVWVSDEELHAALARDVPTFDGTLPMTDGIHNLVVESLQRFLKSKNLDRPVEFLTYSHSKTKALKYLFKVTDPALRVCAMRLDGASPAWEKRFAEAVAAQVGRPSSRVSVEGLTAELEGTYRTRGRLDATIGTAAVRLNDGCDGVSVTIPVTEGDEYSWERVSWTGNSVVSSADLDRLLGARIGAVAETAVLEPGLTAVRAVYGKRGHVQAHLSVSPRGDKTTRRAHLEVQVTEGPQFHMGTIQFVGLSDADATNLTKRWKLKPGQVFDTSYLNEFRVELLPVLKQRQLTVRGPNVTADVAAKLVNVRYEFRPPGGD